MGFINPRLIKKIMENITTPNIIEEIIRIAEVANRDLIEMINQEEKNKVQGKINKDNQLKICG